MLAPNPILIWPTSKRMRAMTNLERFTKAYIDMLYFVSTGNDEEDLPYDIELDPDCRLDIEADCRSFWRRFGCYVLVDGACNSGHDPVTHAGADFFLTRNGHGAGFWDGDWSTLYSVILDEGATSYGSAHPYAGDDGIMYIGE